jgi:hypothetical protein
MRQEQSKGGRMMFIAKWRRCRSLLQTLSGFAPTGYGVDLRPHMSVDEAVSFLRRDARDRAQTIYYAYVTDAEERPLGTSHFQGFANNTRRQDSPERYAHRRDHCSRALRSSSARRPFYPIQPTDDPPRRLGKAH